jgi:hypothetical protein
MYEEPYETPYQIKNMSKCKSLFISPVGYIRNVYNNKDVSKTTMCTITKT